MMKTEHQIYGLHAVLALLQTQPKRILRLCVLKQREDTKINLILQLASTQQVMVEQCSKAQLDQLTQTANHQGVVAYCQLPPTYTEQDLPFLLQTLSGPPFILILDGVQDPHNLGACFRSAEAAGVHFLIAPKDKSAGLTPAVCKVASGATASLPFVQVTNLVRVLEVLKEQGIWIYGAAGLAEQSLYQTDFPEALAIVLGAEGSGLRRLTKEHCDQLIHIPMQGRVSSLNVSVATGVILFEVLRQKIKSLK